MSYTYAPENEAERGKQIRNGRIAMLLCLAWWIASIGGVIFVINTTN